MNFYWIFKTPEKGWWANYRWHITEPSEKLGLEFGDWKKSLFRQGWQSKVLEIKDLKKAKKCLQALQNGIITAFGGRFRGASYDKNAQIIVKQAKRSLKETIKRQEKQQEVSVEGIVAVPRSYYNWKLIIGISFGLVAFVAATIFFFLRKRKAKFNSLT